MKTTEPAFLTVISTNDPGAPAEYYLLDGDTAWGWVVRVDIDGEFAGYQLVRWGDMMTIRLRAWSQVQHLTRHPAASILHAYSSWEPTKDLFAKDVLAAEAEAAALAREARASRAERQEHHAKLAAIPGGGRAVYHGSLSAGHGACRILGFCDCDICDDDPVRLSDPRITVVTDSATIQHVRLSSITLA